MLHHSDLGLADTFLQNHRTKDSFIESFFYTIMVAIDMSCML